MNAGSNNTPARPHPTARYDGGKQLYEFINQMRMMLRTYKTSFTSEPQKIDYVSMHLVGGGALAWFTALTNIQDPRVSRSVEEFFAVLKLQYGGIDPQHEANLGIDNLRQGVRSASDYISYFLQLSSRSTYSNDTLVNALRRGLNRALAERVCFYPHTYDLMTPQRQILEAEITLQEQASLRRRPFQQESWRQLNRNPRRVMGPEADMANGTNSRIPQHSRANTEVESMEVDHMNASFNMESERSRRRTAGLCFYCGSGGHLVWNCPIRPETRQQSWTSSRTGENLQGKCSNHNSKCYLEGR